MAYTYRCPDSADALLRPADGLSHADVFLAKQIRPSRR